MEVEGKCRPLVEPSAAFLNSINSKCIYIYPPLPQTDLGGSKSRTDPTPLHLRRLAMGRCRGVGAPPYTSGLLPESGSLGTRGGGLQSDSDIKLRTLDGDGWMGYSDESRYGYVCEAWRCVYVRRYHAWM